MKKISLFFYLYIVAIFGLFLYSYTQVDLSLTLSKASIYQTIEKGFQYIGYFDRPLSTVLYCSILAILFLFYFLFIYAANHKLLDKKRMWLLIAVVGTLLTFSYNAFSYDLFNYIFAAKLVIHYHQNPYLVHALDFPKDPMLSFMHWTHNTYQYGPFSLGITLPFYFIGFGYFLPTFYLFKILSTLCYLGATYFFQKILQKVNPSQAILGVVLFALNPLILIESLVSAHNDIIMMFFAIMGVYLILKKWWLRGFVAIIISALIKDVTVLLLAPVILYVISSISKKYMLSEKLFLWACSISVLLGFVYVITKIEIQPWYSLWFLPFLFLLKLPKLLLAILMGFCLGVLLRYVPFLWQGDWNGMASIVKLYVTIFTPLLFFASEGIWLFLHNEKK